MPATKILRRLGRAAHRFLARGTERPKFDKSKLQASGYASQEGQDKWLTQFLLPGLKNGTFVEIGAFDGVSFSNTLFLEQELGWSGLAIEPNPNSFSKLTENRTCECIHGCVLNKSGTQAFELVEGESTMLSGAQGYRDLRHTERIHREINANRGQIQLIEVPCFTLEQLLEEHSIRRVDYLSIDVEGAELAILENLRLDEFDIRVIGVENNYQDPRIPLHLVRNGYRFHSIVGDEFYVKDT